MNGARDEFDVDPEEWRQQFWGSDARPADATAKPNGAGNSGWGDLEMGILRLRRRPPPVLPLQVFGDKWGNWIADAAAACPARRCIAVFGHRLGPVGNALGTGNRYRKSRRTLDGVRGRQR
jgi:hypothetical protein